MATKASAPMETEQEWREMVTQRIIQAARAYFMVDSDFMKLERDIDSILREYASVIDEGRVLEDSVSG